MRLVFSAGEGFFDRCAVTWKLEGLLFCSASLGGGFSLSRARRGICDL